MRDQLGENGTEPGSVILNYADPGLPIFRQGRVGISRSEEVFLRIVAYVPFAEKVIIPARYILEGSDVFESVTWSRRLLEQGLLIPERRAGSTSYEQLARERKLGEKSINRGNFLDRYSGVSRSFRWEGLSSAFRESIIQDLGSQGGIRKVISGSIKGKYKNIFDSIQASYVKSEAETLDDFVDIVRKYCPQEVSMARRWAMARYYTTPMLFDDANIREIPHPAAEILVRGGVLEPSLVRGDLAAPAEQLRQTLATRVWATDIRDNFERYCDASLRVRDEVPEARTLFKEICSDEEVRGLCHHVSMRMDEELKRQLRIRSTEGLPISFASNLAGSLLGGVAGLLLGGPEAALAGFGAGLAIDKFKGTLTHVITRRQKPWKVAIDRFSSVVANPIC